MKSQVRAFTLIELLVVIAIIAILAAILFPVFAQAKLAAKKTADLSNTKQTALGIVIYTNDSDDVFPNASFWDGKQPYSNQYMWSSALCTQPYIKNTDLLNSPADSLKSAHDAAYYGLAANRVPKPLSFLVNSITPAYAQFGVDSPQGLMPEAYTMPPQYGYIGSAVTTSATAASSPADIILLAGGNKEIYDGVYYCGEWLNNEIDWCYAGSGISEQWKVDSLTLAVPGDRQYNGWRKFSGSSNFAFGDGHAKSLRPGDLRDPKRWVINPPSN
jgi:prepilin-type N-terminal cleavage/methylation domain-containing protein/prepilin-type processing-associated H-X9-DG protein